MIQIHFENEHNAELTRKAGVSGSLLIVKTLDGKVDTRYNLANASIVRKGQRGKVGQAPDVFTVTIEFGAKECLFAFKFENERDEFAALVFTAQRAK